MKTKQIYYQDPYLKKLACKIIGLEEKANFVHVILDQTIFYPEGGGQPSDRGMLKSGRWSAKVHYVRLIDGEIVHQTKPVKGIKVGDSLEAEIDWNWRYKYMKIHSAGHLLHDVLMTMTKSLIPLRASHGKKAFLEYKGSFDVDQKEALEKKLSQAISDKLPIITKEASYEELQKECQFLPPNLPKNKELRMVKIGDYAAMPDGGVHVKNTGEIGKVWIANIISDQGKTTIKYGVAG